MLMEIQGQETVSDCKNPFRTFYIAVTHFGVWLLICIYAIKIKQNDLHSSLLCRVSHPLG